MSKRPIKAAADMFDGAKRQVLQAFALAETWEEYADAQLLADRLRHTAEDRYHERKQQAAARSERVRGRILETPTD